MDALLIDLQYVSFQFLPILGAVSLLFICIFLKKLANLMDKLSNSVDVLENTIKLIDKSIEKAQTPLDTVVKLSHTVDNVHDSSIESINKAKKFINENVKEVKKHVNQQFVEEKEINNE